MQIIYLFIHLFCALTGIPKITLRVLHSSSRLQIFLNTFMENSIVAIEMDLMAEDKRSFLGSTFL